MKNKFFAVAGIVFAVFGLVLTACEPEAKPDAYKYETSRITGTQEGSFKSEHPSGPDYTFSERKGFRTELHGFSDSNGLPIESKDGVSESKLKTFLDQVGISDSEYIEIKNYLDSSRNGIIFQHINDLPDPNDDYYVRWIYIERE
jgi:hypothetical protein